MKIGGLWRGGQTHVSAISEGQATQRLYWPFLDPSAWIHISSCWLLLRHMRGWLVILPSEKLEDIPGEEPWEQVRMSKAHRLHIVMLVFSAWDSEDLGKDEQIMLSHTSFPASLRGRRVNFGSHSFEFLLSRWWEVWEAKVQAQFVYLFLLSDETS